MQSGYFHRLNRETATRFWINLPTDRESVLAIEAGAVNCTTNPTHCARLISEEPEYIRGVIDRIVKTVEDDSLAAERVYQEATLRIMKRFLSLCEISGGLSGFVTIQGDPRRDDDADFIVAEALRHYGLGRNVMAKIPVTPAGIQAIEDLAGRGVPICATEIFSVSQAVEVCEAYRRAANRTGNHAAFFVTHITGIFDRYLSEYVQQRGIAISPEVLAQAGWAVAHEQYRILKERGYEGIMLGGGAMAPAHFTEMVGGDMHITINWSLAEALLAADGPIAPRIDVPAPRDVVDELSEKLPDFRKAFAEGALASDEYKDYGPLVLFRNIFLQGYGKLLEEIAARRSISS